MTPTPENAPLEAWDKDVDQAKADKAAKDEADKKAAREKYLIIKNANVQLGVKDPREEFIEPFIELDVDDGFFAAVEPGSSVDKLVVDLNRQAYLYTGRTSQIAKDIDGDDIKDMVIIDEKKRKNGEIVLGSDGKPEIGAFQTTIPRYLYSVRFIVKPVVKGDDLGSGTIAESDGALVIRVA